MAKKNTNTSFEKEFIRNVQKQKLHIKVGEKIFNVKKSDKVLLLAGYKVNELLDLVDTIQDVDIDDIDKNNLDGVNDLMKSKNEISEVINSIITIMSGQELLNYVDDDLEFETDEKMELAMALYQMPQEGVSNKDEDSFQDEQ